MLKKAIATSVLSLTAVAAAHASGFSAIGGIGAEVSGYVGKGGGYAATATQGGSMASGNVNGTGLSAQFTSNEGGGYAGAGANIGRDGVVTYTTGGSYANNVSTGYTAGQAQGSTAGAVGTDFSAEAWGNFETRSFGIEAVVGGFGSFGRFGSF